MLNWLRKATSNRPERPLAPDHEIFAVGDIHGRLDLLRALMANIEAAAITERPEIIFLGDYIDRGPQSSEVVEFLLGKALHDHFHPVFLKGNHEATLLEFLNDPRVGPSWMQFGGGETLMSYGVRPPDFKGDEGAWGNASRDLRLQLPPSHKKFYDSLTLCAERGLYFFAHAGVDPNRPIAEQGESDLLWIRELFLEDTRMLERIIVHGHTPQAEPSSDQRRIGLDLGGYQTGRLAAAHIRGEAVSLITN